MKDKTILVTAASRGLGYAVAQTLVQEKARVVICGRTEDSLTQAVSKLGERAEYVVADVSKQDDIKKLVEAIEKKNSKLDGLFINAGGPPSGTFSSVSDEDWRKSFNLTLMSAIWLTREALPLLKESESPSILYSTSISVKQPINNLLLSNSIRPAVIGMMRTLASEIGPDGVRVNAVCPGYFYTARVEQILGSDKSVLESLEADIPLGRLGKPNEFGATCAFLLCPLASYIHGTLMLIDGGLYRGMM
ncbi:MAG: SDR family oxidoreductase [Candidatus Thorarchaeota archaeon]